MNDILRMVTKQEELLRFDSFSNDDAFALGCLLVKHGKKFGPAAVEVSINAVSYTHLDVYKRQFTYSGMRRRNIFDG